MKERYVSLIEKVLSAYTHEHIIRYFDQVKRDGLKEHGFPRLAANIGFLISKGRRTDLKDVFIEMMDLCCRSMSRVKAANDFSVRELIACIWEIERSGAIPTHTVNGWKEQLKLITVENCYDRYAKSTTDTVNNWALFTGVSEFYRQKAGLCHCPDFIDLQLEQQLTFFDELGMYCDAEEYYHNPLVYDLVPRGLMSLILNEGYRGAHYERIDAILKKAGLLTLKMQSPTGEIGFGGRSNQFLHNEAWLIAIYEFEAKRYAKEGNAALAQTFRSAILRAIKNIESWLDKSPITHIKNRFPTETGFGCEHYAYFDKYMITAASNLYAAYSIADDSIPVIESEDLSTSVFMTTDRFAKLFMKSGGYALEFDLDANGLGRIHKSGAPATIAMSCPCPAHPFYSIGENAPAPFAAGSAIFENGVPRTVADGAEYKLVSYDELQDSASATLSADFGSTKTEERYTLSKDGVKIAVTGNGTVGFALPALHFDGESYSEITLSENVLTVSYGGYVCRYEASGKISADEKLYYNRNGIYKKYVASSPSPLNVRITITKKS